MPSIDHLVGYLPKKSWQPRMSSIEQLVAVDHLESQAVPRMSSISIDQVVAQNPFRRPAGRLSS